MRQSAQELFETVMHLPEKYRIVVHLFYYEDYTDLSPTNMQ